MTKTTSRVLGLIGGIAIGSSSHAGTVWMPTDQNVNVLDFSVIISFLPNGDFYLFDDDDAGDLAGAAAASRNLQLADGDLISFQQNGTDWTVSGANGSFDVMGSKNFIFAELSNSVFSMETSASNPGPNQWVLNFGSGAVLQATDVAPVPLPPAVLLFGSAVIGLVAIGRRRARKRLSAIV